MGSDQHEAAHEQTETPGRAWFDRWQAAFLAADLDTIWALQTQASHDMTLASLKETLQAARRDPKIAKALQDRMGADVGGLEPKQVWEAFTKASCEHTAAGHMVWEFVSEERDGEHVVVRLAPGGSRPMPAGMGGELEQVLVEEDGEWRLDKPASEQRAMGA